MTAGHSWISRRNIKKRNLQEECMQQFQFDPDLNPAEIIRAVLRVMYRHMGKGELGDVKSNLPAGIQEWFPEELGQEK